MSVVVANIQCMQLQLVRAEVGLIIKQTKNI